MWSEIYASFAHLMYITLQELLLCVPLHSFELLKNVRQTIIPLH
jgi:hypothetical protein